MRDLVSAEQLRGHEVVTKPFFGSDETVAEQRLYSLSANKEGIEGLAWNRRAIERSSERDNLGTSRDHVHTYGYRIGDEFRSGVS